MPPDRLLRLAHFLHGAGPDEQMFKGNAPLCQCQRFLIGGEMDVPVRKADLRERIPFGDLRGQQLRQHVAAGVERALRGGHDEPVGNAARQPVERQYPPGERSGGGFAFENGVRERLSQQRSARLAVKDVGLARYEPVADVALVEKRHLRAAALVHDAQLHKIHAAADVRQARLGGDHGAHTRRFVRQQLRDRAHGGAVLVVARKIAEKIAERADAQTAESLGTLFPDALYVAYVRCQLRHGFSFRGFVCRWGYAFQSASVSHSA